jgi:5-formyltetrahydrofolate cyclo-ligase
MAAYVTLTSSKKLLRTEIRNILKDLPTPLVETESDAVATHLAGSEVYAGCKSVGIFLSMPKGEIITRGMVARALSDGKDVYVPRVGANFELCDMEMIKVNQDSGDIFATWPKNKWGIPEPPEDADHTVAYEDGMNAIELLIMPGVAFDSKGNRLGQGKGYYDRYLTKISEAGQSRPKLAGIGLSCQFIEGDVPTGEFDVPLDLLIGVR